MHREILKPNEGFETDHINRDRLDNRRSNLRACTTSQNAHNRRLRSDNKTGVMGIWFRKDSRKWTARIVVNGQRKILGCFISKEEAAMAYQQAAQQYYG